MVSNCDKIEKCKSKLRRYEMSIQNYENSVNDQHAMPRTRMAAAKDDFESASEAMWKLMSFLDIEYYYCEPNDCNSPRGAIECFCESGNLNDDEKFNCLSILSLRNRASHEYDSEIASLEIYYTESLSYIDFMIKLGNIFREICKQYIDSIDGE